MPAYEYACASCGAREELVCSIKEHRKTRECRCGEEMRQVLGFKHVVSDLPEYRSMITGEVIRGRSQHRNHLRQHQCIEVGNEQQQNTFKPMPSVAPDIQRALEQLRSR